MTEQSICHVTCHVTPHEWWKRDGRADTSVPPTRLGQADPAPTPTNPGGRTPPLHLGQTHQSAPTHSRPRPYGRLFTARLLTLCGASVNPSRCISRPILHREYKNFILHILRHLRGEETKRDQMKQISGGGKNKGSKFAVSNRWDMSHEQWAMSCHPEGKLTSHFSKAQSQ